MLKMVILKTFLCVTALGPGFLSVAAICTPSSVQADEIDDLLARRQKNFAKLRRLHMEQTVDTARPAMNGKPERKLRMKFGFTITPADRKNADPAKHFDTAMDLIEPLEMHVRVQGGVMSFMNPSGKWVPNPHNERAAEFLAGLSERNASDVPGLRKAFGIQRLKSRDNLWGTRKGLVFLPKGKAKMFARKEETVDVATGQPVEVDLFDDKGKRTYHLKVRKLGIHNGVAVAEDTETETDGPVGVVKQRTVATQVEVETE